MTPSRCDPRRRWFARSLPKPIAFSRWIVDNDTRRRQSLLAPEAKEDQTVPIVRLKNADTYDRAIAVLLRRGGSFSGRDPLTLVVNPAQFQALVEEGVVKPRRPHKDRPNGQTKTKT
jgi:hypothetical protein